MNNTVIFQTNRLHFFTQNCKSLIYNSINGNFNLLKIYDSKGLAFHLSIFSSSTKGPGPSIVNWDKCPCRHSIQKEGSGFVCN